MNTPESKNFGADPVIDFDQLQGACDGDVALMRELVDLYFHQAAEIMTGLDRAITGSVVGEVDHLAHKLAGSSLACGMSAVVPSLRKLEGNAKAGHMNGARELYTEVVRQMEIVRHRVYDRLGQLPSG